MADALFNSVKVMIGVIKRMFCVLCLIMILLDVVRFLAVQEPDDELVYRVISVRISSYHTALRSPLSTLASYE